MNTQQKPALLSQKNLQRRCKYIARREVLHQARLRNLPTPVFKIALH